MHDRRKNSTDSDVERRGEPRRHSARNFDCRAAAPPRPIRKRVNDLFSATCESRVRLLTGPTGWGKSTALRAYLDSRPGEIAYVDAGPAETFDGLRSRIAALDGVAEVIIDDADTLHPDEGGALTAFVARESHHRRFLIAGRAHDRIPGRALLKLDAATTIDAAALAFDHDEATALARSYDVRYRHEDLEAVLFDTDGWPLALEWVLRYSAYDSLPLYLGYARWRQHCLPHLLAYVARRCGAHAGAYAEFVRTASSCEESDTQAKLRVFRDLGFPVASGRQSMRALRFYATPPVDDSYGPKSDRIAPLHLKLFGRFACDIEGRNVPFKRRRDRHVFSYIALTAKGCVTRDELVTAFWRDADPTVASQSLRTTLSRIRLALSEIVGADDVAHYFQSDGEIRVDLANVSVDTRRFVAHIERAEVDAARGARAASEHHYAAAERLYDDHLLSSEPIEACFEPAIAALERAYEHVLSVLSTESPGARLEGEKSERHSKRLARRRAPFGLPLFGGDGTLAMR